MDELSLEPYAACCHWRFGQPLPPERWQALVAQFLEDLGRATTAEGTRVIGHIKCLALLPGGGLLRGSLVSARYSPDVAIEGPSEAVCELEMSLNVLVYGLPRVEARRLVLEIGQALAASWDGELVVETAGDAHHHHKS